MIESDFSDAKVYSLLFEATIMASDGEGNLSQEKLVRGNITTDPLLNHRIDSNPIPMNGKLKYFIDGSTYCNDKIRQTDCSYDVRMIMKNGSLQVRIHQWDKISLMLST